MKFDLRTFKRYLREGRISQKEWEAHLKSLPDESENVEEIVVSAEEKKSKGVVSLHKTPTFALAAES